MNSQTRTVACILGLIFLFSLGFSLFINIPSIQKNFLFADEAVYFSMTQSLAFDGDLEYTKKDLRRYYQVFDSGPLGIFLKKGKHNKIFYSKSFAYSLFAAPFVRLLGYNGFFVFHSLLLTLVLIMGYSYISLSEKPFPSLFCILTFLFASVAVVYYVWMSPDFFNMFLVFAVLFLWGYKHKSFSLDLKKSSCFLYSPWSDYTASFLVGLAAFSKPPNILLMIPLFLLPLFKKKLGKCSIILILFLLSSGIFWGTNHMITGEWNYQGGERKTFYYDYPFEEKGMTFENLGRKMSYQGYGEKHLLPLNFILYDVFYYFMGRFTGIIWYFFPAFLFLILFFLQRKSLPQWLLLAALVCEIGLYIILMPDNYSGGGGSLANRYFLNIYPLFFFLPFIQKNTREIAASWIIASLFISPILISPFRHSHFPATHAKKIPYKWLPVELTLIDNLPTNTRPEAFARKIGKAPHFGYLYFLDDHFHPKREPDGFWTKGTYKAEIVLKTSYPIKKLIFHLRNNRRKHNTIAVQVEDKKKKIVLGRKNWGHLTISPGKGFPMKKFHLYQIKIQAEKGAVPAFEVEKSKDKRYLGVFFNLEIIPE